ncbi:SDR family NAD(P)-dependent oxidoreductase [Bosea caraganae]|uniref:SDR family NAD(P)-dependent oxidoreductase n=1 Tax=Bosea caraganae TaxID=2763117 RepID=A0A370L7H4_9HYPH|nr:SDR family NAD(P)-dependent oxidoreductase [Bosea caraganae]RDJ24895.1 SDR family NAD(P)-dependent oxidoreductase [Bosea caraganae]RDJ26007.1 SDR family NAD(P)-dependent oxidoreductase [Bosea caraganae]
MPQSPIAVVTGGAKGIGRAIADRLEQDGLTPVIWDLEAPRERGWGHIACDVSNEEQVAAAVSRTESEHGPIAVLVNNAGMTGPSTKVAETPLAQWLKVQAVNLTGTFLCSRAVADVMATRGYGRIVNIASLAGKEGTPTLSAYSAAKAGVLAFTKSHGKELAQTGVLVNAVAPAAIDTDILQQMSPETVAAMIAKSPLGRLGEVEELAELVAWLASERCSFSTGAVFDLSGGRATY